MNSSIKDKTQGTFHEVKGKVKEVAGKLSKNKELEAKGKAEIIAGKTQKKVGEVKKAFDE